MKQELPSASQQDGLLNDHQGRKGLGLSSVVLQGLSMTQPGLHPQYLVLGLKKGSVEQVFYVGYVSRASQLPVPLSTRTF